MKIKSENPAKKVAKNVIFGGPALRQPRPLGAPISRKRNPFEPILPIGEVETIADWIPEIWLQGGIALESDVRKSAADTFKKVALKRSKSHLQTYANWRRVIQMAHQGKNQWGWGGVGNAGSFGHLKFQQKRMKHFSGRSI